MSTLLAVQPDIRSLSLGVYNVFIWCFANFKILALKLNQSVCDSSYVTVCVCLFVVSEVWRVCWNRPGSGNSQVNIPGPWSVT